MNFTGVALGAARPRPSQISLPEKCRDAAAGSMVCSEGAGVSCEPGEDV